MGPFLMLGNGLLVWCDPQDPGVFDALTIDGMQFHFRDKGSDKYVSNHNFYMQLAVLINYRLHF